MIKLIIESTLTEGSVVTFGGQPYPNGGWAVCLAGGPGSGKGFSSEKYFLLDFKRFDVDELKKKFNKAIKNPKSNFKKYSGRDDYDFSNPDDVSDLHNIVKKGGWNDKQQTAFFTDAEEKLLPNVLFDVTGDDPNKLIRYAKTTKDLGYKTSLVWVVTNREEAMIRNVLRDRSVSDTILHSKHNAINSNLYKFITSTAGQYFDECWIVFGSNAHAGGSEQEAEWLKKHRTIQLKKSGASFVPTNKEAARIFMTLGGEEPNPENPQRYMKQDRVRNVVKSRGVTSRNAATTNWGNVRFSDY